MARTPRLVRLAAVVASTVACTVACTSPRPAPAPEAFDRLVDATTREYFALIPQMVTYYGVPPEIAGAGLDARLDPQGPAAEISKRAAFRAMIARLEAVDRSGLTERDSIVHETLLTQLRGNMAPAEVVEYGSAFGDYGVWFLPYPVTQLSGPQVRALDLLEKQHTIRSRQQADAYLERLRSYGEIVDQTIAKIEHDRKLGVSPPTFVLEKAIAGLTERTAGEPSESSLVTSFAKKVADAGLDAGLTDEAARLVGDVVFPANRRLAEVLRSLLPAASPHAGIWRLPRGAELYRALIVHMTDTTLGPEEIHALGLAEVARIIAEMDAVLQSEGLVAGTVGERMTALGKDERFRYANTEAGKERLIADLNAQMEEIAPLLPKWFGTLPEQKVVVQRVPVHAEESSTGGFYDAPALDGSRPGTYWINLRDTAIYPSFSLNTLTYHEANPGHHLQTAVGMGLGAPILLSALYSNSFGEGWGLYAEALAKEMGLYEGDPYGDLGRLQAELHRAIRLVVDTGMHALRWSREQALRYMVENEGVHPVEAQSEIDRYAVWPGQALGYKIGMLKIQQLRADAAARLGDRFDVREFHDELLKDGGVPLQVLERKVARWVERVEAR